MKKAKWIWNNHSDSVNQYVDFEQKISVIEKEACVLRVSVAGNYCVKINGVFVACARFDDYQEYKMFDEIEIGEYLHEGENIVQILAYFLGRDSLRSVKIQAAMLAEIVDGKGEVLWYTDEHTLSRISPFYKSGEMLTHGNDKSYSSEITLSTEQDTAFDYSILVPVKYNLVKRAYKRCQTGNLLPSTLITQGVFRVDNISHRGQKMQNAWLSFRHLSALSEEYEKPTFPSKPLEVSTQGDYMYMIFDLQAEQNGYIHFDFTLKENADVEFAFGEHLQDLRVRSEVGGRNYTSVIHAKKGDNVFTDYINRIGCRYLQVFVYAPYCKMNYFGMIYDGYPIKEYPYSTDNYLRQKIYDVSVKTLKECMHEHYEDCPSREQALYAMDSRNQMLCGYYAFQEYEFARENLILLFKRLRKDGNIPMTVPDGLGLTIPCFTLVGFLAVLEYTEYSKDLSLSRQLLPTLESILQKFVSRLDGNGLLRRLADDDSVWDFYEWTEGMWNKWGDHPLQDGSVEYPLVLNAFLVVALDSYCKMVRLLGARTDLYAEYETVSQKIKQTIAEKFWWSEKGCFAAYETDGNLTHDNELANTMALYCGAGTTSQKQEVVKKLKTEKLSPMTLSMMMYKYQALLDFDEENIDYVLKDIDEKWGYMLFNNATTFWETIKGADDFGGAGSLCHAWSAIPVYFYKRYENK